MEKGIYLNNKAWQEALDMMFNSLQDKCGPVNETVDVRQALGRVTGQTVHARRSSPHYPAAAMDGYAIQAKNTFGISERQPRWLKFGGETVQVDTGDAMPAGMDAVIMLEEVLEENGEGILVQSPVAPGENVRPVGEDIVAGEVILPVNHRIRPQDQGALLASGVLKVEVRKKPQVGILPTGDEIRSPESDLGPGDIADSNSTVLASLVEEWGGTSKVWPITPDKQDELEEVLLEMASSQDILVFIAGSSQGRDDYTARIIQKYGKLLIHGVAIKPGKPVILGEIKGKPAIGIPGYPVSAYVTARLFLEPWVKYLLGLSTDSALTVEAVLTKKLYSSLGSEEFVRVKIGKVGKRWIAAPISRGAGVTMSLVRADGFIRIPRLEEGYHDGETVKVELLRPLAELEYTLIGIGSHDLTLDLLTSHLRLHGRGGAVASAHVGSLAGLLALRKQEAHFAGVHLLDPATGEYNRTYLARLLPGQDVRLLNLVYRTQGLIVPKGNPRKLKELGDLAREGIRFVNRQGGSGTRVLLDYLLEKQGLDKEQINGYEWEEFTHLGVAVAVASGSADAGLGIQSAAVTLGLDFIPIGEERYDLAIPAAYLEDKRIQNMLAVIRSREFQEDVLALGGYDVRDTGKFIE